MVAHLGGAVVGSCCELQSSPAGRVSVALLAASIYAGRAIYSWLVIYSLAADVNKANTKRGATASARCAARLRLAYLRRS